MGSDPTSTCEALYGFTPDDAQTCGRPGATYVTLGCVHEHLDSYYICDRCTYNQPGCLECWEIDGHVCPLLIVNPSK